MSDVLPRSAVARLRVLQSHLLSKRLHSVVSAISSWTTTTTTNSTASPKMGTTDDGPTAIPRSLLQFSPEVQDALDRNLPLVALESTIITHGMPFPANLETALAVEATVRQNGAVPATIAIIHGRIHVGLTAHQIEFLSKLPSKAVRKCSRRDLATCLASRAHGSTTVAATSVIAHAAGISIFVTGGIGGVHHHVEESWDISADLYELAQTPMCVVCAGAKSILDIPKTLEVLESLGVPTLGYGTSEFPAFFTSHSGEPCSEMCPADPKHVAKILLAQRKLRLKSGIVLGVPIPAEFEADGSKIQTAIDAALKECADLKIRGREATPFLLKRVNELTGGESLRSNIGLIKNNAKVGSQIAVCFSDLQMQKRIVCAGAVLMDCIAKSAAPAMLQNTSNPGSTQLTAGGVGFNVYIAVHRLAQALDVNTKVDFLTAVNPLDAFGRQLLESIPNPTWVMQVEKSHSGSYTAVTSSAGDSFLAVADTAILKDSFSARNMKDVVGPLMRPNPRLPILAVFDANIPLDGFSVLVTETAAQKIPIFFEPTSIVKASMPIEMGLLKYIAYAKPCLAELFALTGLTSLVDAKTVIQWEDGDTKSLLGNSAFLSAVTKAALVAVVDNGMRILFCTLGRHGGICIRRKTEVKGGSNPKGPVRFRNLAPKHPSVELLYFPALPISKEDMVNTCGAGDCFSAGVIIGMVFDLEALEDVVFLGQEAARQSIRVQEAVPLHFDSTPFSGVIS
ncbi:mitochondrial pseudouridine-5'-phosphate glycosidase (pseudoU degradation) [Andalucia godoyi]|uniref:Mitochondrial pseudouridine-5'-phosphate glycosidase (PseudoU degradation) n=1 Tax=Andalucia godoyi TaxID=505711 RepID=A0A8K0F2E2_ANDGO|nr:mitochondrial pseudouridine-5'-phosphate glycosidase (pseudoU degradation) [Andalucia godoyi]|eukprot:ANDGO_02977.mRNA.1 mitochondrial pseudouridine-5'-phosphate glycosidase (pseudoU degradation)